MLAYLGTSAVNIMPLMNRIRIKKITITTVSSGRAGEYVGVNYTRTLDGTNLPFGDDRECPILSTTEPISVSFTPPKQYLAAQFLSASDTNAAMYVMTNPGAYVDIDCDCMLSEGVTSSVFGCLAGSLDSLGWSPLDLGSAAAGSRVVLPFGQVNIFN